MESVKTKYQANSNPNAKIGFVIYYPFQFYVYKNIYEELRSEAEFIVDLFHPFPADRQNDLLGDIISLLKRHNAYYKILYHEDYRYEQYLGQFFSKYQCLISVWERGCMELECTDNIKKVNTTYGAGKELTMVRSSKGMYDLILAYGKRDVRLFSYYSNAKIVGNPKFDDWFNNKIDSQTLNKTMEVLDRNKKTVLYLPTHSDLSSIDEFADNFKKATETYNVLVKVHYYTMREEPERINKLRHKNITLLGDDVDLLPLLKVSDVVVSDNSSAIFDAILADKPVVVADFWGKEFLDEKHKELRKYKRGEEGALTYSDSIEQIIKREGAVITIQNKNDLNKKIGEALTDSSFYKKKRQELREELFEFNDGRCAKRAASKITDLISCKSNIGRPILYHATEVFKRRMGLLSHSMMKKKLLELEAGKKHLDETIFSIIVIHDPTKTEFLKNEFLESTLRSLLELSFSHQNYEILIVNGPPEEEIMEIINGIRKIGGNIPVVKCITPTHGNLALEFIEDAINIAEGEIICFTKSGYLVPSDWLSNFSLAYNKYHPDVAGVGGYSVKYNKDKYYNAYNIFDEYYYLELGRRVGMHREYGYLNKLREFTSTLFYQNPAGDLSNMSYKKDALNGLAINYQEIFSLELLEMSIKNAILRDGKTLCFIPSHVTSLEKMTLKTFVRRNFREGLAQYLFVLTNPMLKQYYSYNLFSVIKIPLLNILDGYWKFRLTAVLLVGTLYRWLGQTYGALMRRLYFAKGAHS